MILLNSFFEIFITLFCIIENASAVVPVRFGRDGLPYIIGHLDQVGSQRFRNLRNVLHLGTQTHLYTPRRMPPRFITRSPVLELPTNSSIELRVQGITSGNYVLEEKQLLAIGPQSDLVQSFGSVSFVHNFNRTGSIIFGGSETEFQTHCFSDTIIRIPTTEHRGYPNYSFTFGRFPQWSEARVQIRFASIEQILLLPARIMATLFDQFPNIAGGESILSECTQNRDRLPEIQLALEPDNESGYMIILKPEDYTRKRIVNDPQNTPTDECDILIRKTPYPENQREFFIEVNPLLIPGFNSYSAHNFLALCESRHYSE